MDNKKNLIADFKLARILRLDKWITGYQRMWKLLETVTAINNITFDNTLSTKTSKKIDVKSYEKFALFIDLNVTATPTDITIEVLFSDDDRTYYTYATGPYGSLMYEDSAGDKKEYLTGEIIADYMKIKATATGTTAANKFTLTTKVVLRS